jgi:hypothetical protein
VDDPKVLANLPDERLIDFIISPTLTELLGLKEVKPVFFAAPRERKLLDANQVIQLDKPIETAFLEKVISKEMNMTCSANLKPQAQTSKSLELASPSLLSVTVRETSGELSAAFEKSAIHMLKKLETCTLSDAKDLVEPIFRDFEEQGWVGRFMKKESVEPAKFYHCLAQRLRKDQGPVYSFMRLLCTLMNGGSREG